MQAANDIQIQSSGSPPAFAPVNGSGARSKFRTIVADPPWGYEKKGSPWYSGSAPAYELMPLEAICALPVRELATNDAHLYLWAVLPMMREAYEVVEAWGFVADTMLTWCKPGPGLGGGWRGNTEHVIVARRGESYMNPTCTKCGQRARGKTRKCLCAEPVWHVRGEIVAQKQAFLSLAKGTWYEAPRRDHSEKPDIFMDMIEQMSPEPRLEMFARSQRLGWSSWGNEAINHVGLVLPNAKLSV